MDMITKLTKVDGDNVRDSIRIIKEYVQINNKLKEDIKGNNAEIKNEYNTVLVNTFGKDVAQIVLKHAKDDALVETMESELRTIDFLKEIFHE